MELRQAWVFKKNVVDQTSAITGLRTQPHSQNNFGNDTRVEITSWGTSQASGLDVSRAEINYTMIC